MYVPSMTLCACYGDMLAHADINGTYTKIHTCMHTHRVQYTYEHYNVAVTILTIRI